MTPLIHQQGIICCVAFDRSTLRRILHTPQASLPQRLASDTLLAPRVSPKSIDFHTNTEIRRWIWQPPPQGPILQKSLPDDNNAK
jgi:hypothetical protein